MIVTTFATVAISRAPFAGWGGEPNRKAQVPPVESRGRLAAPREPAALPETDPAWAADPAAVEASVARGVSSRSARGAEQDSVVVNRILDRHGQLDDAQ